MVVLRSLNKEISDYFFFLDYLQATWLYKHEIFCREVSLHGSHYIFIIVNDPG